MTSVLNFAPCVLDVPDDVMVRKVDLSTELQILAFHEQRRVATRFAVDGSTCPTGRRTGRRRRSPASDRAGPTEVAR